eukprot:scaffold146405_cov18-Prasinocladus_malaysianus.AAC.1
MRITATQQAVLAWCGKPIGGVCKGANPEMSTRAICATGLPSTLSSGSNISTPLLSVYSVHCWRRGGIDAVDELDVNACGMATDPA